MEKETLTKTRKEGALKKTEKYKRIYKILEKNSTKNNMYTGINKSIFVLNKEKYRGMHTRWLPWTILSVGIETERKEGPEKEGSNLNK